MGSGVDVSERDALGELSLEAVEIRGSVGSVR
jgi:hypothetical protein